MNDWRPNLTRIQHDLLWVIGGWVLLAIALMLNFFVVDAIKKLSLVVGMLMGIGLVACIRMTVDFLDGVVSRDREPDDYEAF